MEGGPKPPQDDNPIEDKPKQVTTPTPEGHVITPEEQAMIDTWLAAHPVKDVTRESLDARAEKVRELDSLMAKFETAHDLDALTSIVDLDAKDAPNHPIRQPAKLALNPIVALLEEVKRDPDVSADRKADLEARYKKLSRAVGIINNGKVDHTR